MRNLTLDPFIPLALWVPLALAAAALVAWYAASSRGRLPGRRWPAVIALMTLVLVVPLAILLNPTWLERIPPPAGKPLLTLLTKTLGGQTGVRDLEVALGMPQELAFVGQRVPVSVALRQRGTLGRQTGVALVHDGKTLEKRQVELTGDGLPQPKRFAPVPSGSDPGQFRVAFGRLAEGRYAARLVAEGVDKAASTAAFDVRGNLAERLDVRAQPGLMQRLADASGGTVLDDAAPDRLARQFDEHLTLTRPERLARTTAWDRWWVLLGTMAVWGATWGLRRWSGLV